MKNAIKTINDQSIYLNKIREEIRRTGKAILKGKDEAKMNEVANTLFAFKVFLVAEMGSSN